MTRTSIGPSADWAAAKSATEARLARSRCTTRTFASSRSSRIRCAAATPRSRSRTASTTSAPAPASALAAAKPEAGVRAGDDARRPTWSGIPMLCHLSSRRGAVPWSGSRLTLAHERSCMGMITSRTMSIIAAATGTARIAPVTPEQGRADQDRHHHATGGDVDRPPHHPRVQPVRLEQVLAQVEDARDDADRHALGESDQGDGHTHDDRADHRDEVQHGGPQADRPGVRAVR